MIKGTLLVISFFAIYIFVLNYIEAKIAKRENENLLRNIDKHETLTGGLENDRINERP
jgi:hypothetical protein